MKDEKDILLDDFFKATAELELEDNGFSEKVISALPERQKVGNHAVERLRKEVRLLKVFCIAAGIALFIVLRGWNIAFDILASLIATAATFDYTYLIFSLLLLPLTALAAMVYLVRTSYRLF